MCADGSSHGFIRARSRALLWPSLLVAASCAAFVVLSVPYRRLLESRKALAATAASCDQRAPARYRALAGGETGVRPSGPATGRPSVAGTDESPLERGERGGRGGRDGHDGHDGGAGESRPHGASGLEIALLVALMLPGVAIIALMAASRSARAVFLPPPWLAPVAGWDTLGFLQGTALVFLLMAYRGLVESVGFPGSMLGSAALWTIFQIALTAVVAVLASSGTVRRLASGGPHGRPSSGTRDPPRHWPPLDGGEVRPLVRRAEAEGLRSLGLVGANARAAALTGLGVALAALPVVSGLAWFVRRFAPSDMHPVLEALMERPGAAESALLVAGACVVTPVFEEVVFRGFIYASIRDRMGLWAGLMLSAFLFALPHPSPADQIATFALGVAFALAYERTGSLVGPVVAHAAFNAANVAQVLAL